MKYIGPGQMFSAPINHRPVGRFRRWLANRLHNLANRANPWREYEGWSMLGYTTDEEGDRWPDTQS